MEGRSSFVSFPHSAAALELDPLTLALVSVVPTSCQGAGARISSRYVEIEQRSTREDRLH
jgi:hypothetical protein